MIKKNLEKQERKERRKPTIPCTTYEKTKKQRMEAKRKKYSQIIW